MAKTMTGMVVSDKADKSIVVLVSAKKTHPLYKKQYIKGTRFMAHDQDNKAKVGDKVVIAETKPISAKKRFVLEKIVATAAIKHKESETTEGAKP